MDKSLTTIRSEAVKAAITNAKLHRRVDRLIYQLSVQDVVSGDCVKLKIDERISKLQAERVECPYKESRTDYRKWMDAYNDYMSPSDPADLAIQNDDQCMLSIDELYEEDKDVLS